MAIPNIPEFEEILSSLTRVNPNDTNYGELIISNEIQTVNSKGSLTTRASVILWHNTKLKINIGSLIKKIISELKQITHEANDEIAKTILFLYTFKRTENAVDSFNILLKSFAKCEVSQFHILRSASNSNIKGVSFGDFTFGLLDIKRFEYKCERAGSDYFRLYGASFEGNLCIEKKRFDGVVINWHALSNGIRWSEQRDFIDKVLLYFESVSRSLFEKFWNEFNDQQDIHVTAGFDVIIDKVFKEMFGASSITIFLKINVNDKNFGYVVPAELGFYNFLIPFNLGSNISTFYELLKSKYSFIGFENNELNQTLKTYCKFIAKGYRYLMDFKTDEGYLHFIIALDLVFGDKNENTKTVANRCAILSYLEFGNNYLEQKKILNELYDFRSRYVHQGSSVNNDCLEKAKRLCTQIFYCFLRLNKYYKEPNNFDIELWKKKLDYACSAIDAKEDLSDILKMEIGLALKD